MEPMIRIERTTYALRKRCSATELHRPLHYPTLKADQAYRILGGEPRPYFIDLHRPWASIRVFA
jgi:hypothetical protein